MQDNKGTVYNMENMKIIIHPELNWVSRSSYLSPSSLNQKKNKSHALPILKTAANPPKQKEQETQK
jgi:hypothetical protein